MKVAPVSMSQDMRAALEADNALLEDGVPWVRWIRGVTGITQEDFALIGGISVSHLRKFESAERRPGIGTMGLFMHRLAHLGEAHLQFPRLAARIMKQAEYLSPAEIAEQMTLNGCGALSPAEINLACERAGVPLPPKGWKEYISGRRLLDPDRLFEIIGACHKEGMART